MNKEVNERIIGTDGHEKEGMKGGREEGREGGREGGKEEVGRR